MQLTPRVAPLRRGLFSGCVLLPVDWQIKALSPVHGRSDYSPSRILPDVAHSRARALVVEPDTSGALCGSAVQDSSAISPRASACFSSDQAKPHARLARSTPITGVALARNLASIAASLMGLSAVPLAWAM